MDGVADGYRDFLRLSDEEGATCRILFHAGTWDLKTIWAGLQSAGLKVDWLDGGSCHGYPCLQVHVGFWAGRVQHDYSDVSIYVAPTEGVPIDELVESYQPDVEPVHREALAACDAGLDILFDHPAVLDDFTTLEHLEAVLQEMLGGFIEFCNLGEIAAPSANQAHP